MTRLLGQLRTIPGRAVIQAALAGLAAISCYGDLPEAPPGGGGSDVGGSDVGGVGGDSSAGTGGMGPIAGSGGSIGGAEDAGATADATDDDESTDCGAEGEPCCDEGTICSEPFACNTQTRTCELCGAFEELVPPAPYEFSRAGSVSGDGTVVVGEVTLGAQNVAFRWLRSTRRMVLFPDDSSLISSYASSTNGDGSVVVGRTELTSDGTGARAFRWSLGAPGYLTVPSGALGSQASDVSADGSVVVGSVDAEAGRRAVRWFEGAIDDLGDLLGDGGRAYRVSADGRVIIGDTQGAGNQRAFRYLWTDRSVENLGVLTGDSTSSARGVSADGSVVVGQSFGGFPATQCPGTELPQQIFSAFRWTASGLTPLDSLICGVGAQAFNLSADGRVAVGIVQTNATTAGNTAVLWDERGVTSIASRLAELRLGAAAGWVLDEASNVSDDGRVIVGNGSNPGGMQRAWIAVLGVDCSGR